MRRATRIRASRPDVEARIIDLSHASVVHDPIGAVRKVYASFDIPFTQDRETAIRLFLAESPSRLGTHKHSAEEFGIDAGEVHRRLADYYRHFGHLLAKA